MKTEIEVASDQPFGDAVRQMQRMMEQLQKNFVNFCPSDTWTPSVNLYENDTSYVLCVDLAGVDKEKIDLHWVDGQLRLRGVRMAPVHPEKPHDRWRVHLMEIDNGSFCRSVDLPEHADSENISASYRNGLLWVEVPKKPRDPATE